MLEQAKTVDNALQGAGWEMLLMVAFWWFVLMTSVGISIMVSLPAMKIFYGTLFDILF